MKNDKEILSSLIKTVQMGQSGIRCVQHKAKNHDLRQALHDQLEEYDAIEEKAYDLATRRGWLIGALDPSVERMASIMSRMKLIGGETDSKIAGMLVQGNTKGMIKSLRDIHRAKDHDSQVKTLAYDLVEREKENIRQASEFL
ncbi:MAG: hypothetical protein IJV82_00720 [Oscillospiraceae bacterium]|nr:hypothetical protein [Oscillospiraceae bacterium]